MNARRGLIGIVLASAMTAGGISAPAQAATDNPFDDATQVLQQSSELLDSDLLDGSSDLDTSSTESSSGSSDSEAGEKVVEALKIIGIATAAAVGFGILRTIFFQLFNI